MHEITTARLYLRPMAKDDFEADYAMVSSDPRVTWNHKAQSRDQAQITLKKRLRHWTDHGFGMYAVIERVTQQLIGHGGLQRLEETSDVELGYYLGWPAWGRGFATELSRAVLRYGFEQLLVRHIVAVVRPENEASQRVLCKVGMKYVRDAHYYGFCVQYWRILSDDFQPQNGDYKVRPALTSTT
jgi:RimJ/RimL family protein N-acetyltransferase